MYQFLVTKEREPTLEILAPEFCQGKVFVSNIFNNWNIGKLTFVIWIYIGIDIFPSLFVYINTKFVIL
jgi:hypothetical protein